LALRLARGAGARRRCKRAGSRLASPDCIRAPRVVFLRPAWRGQIAESRPSDDKVLPQCPPARRDDTANRRITPGACERLVASLCRARGGVHGHPGLRGRPGDEHGLGTLGAGLAAVLRHGVPADGGERALRARASHGGHDRRSHDHRAGGVATAARDTPARAQARLAGARRRRPAGVARRLDGAPAAAARRFGGARRLGQTFF
jgi:hypothetical protein